MKAKLKKYLLLALLAAHDQAMPEKALIGAAQNLARPDDPKIGDITDALKDLEAARLVTGTSDEFETWWALTVPQGLLKARQLR